MDGKQIKKDKKCLNCNLPFHSKNRNALFCCKKCESSFKLKNTEKKILDGEKVGSRALKSYLIRVFGNKCMSKNCSWNWDKNNSVKLELHHIDGDYKNNTLQNCLLLCPNCHSLTENYKYKGKHKSTRLYRKKYYKDGSGDRT